jgi:predicted membrane protein
MRVSNSIWLALFLIALGVLLLLDSLGVAEFGQILRDYWPVILIAAGVALLFPRRQKWHGGFRSVDVGMDEIFGDKKGTTSGDRLESSGVFGDVNMKVDSKSFAGGDISTVLGDIDLDLTTADLAAGEQSLRLNSVMGDMNVRLAPGTAYSVFASNLLGDAKVGSRKENAFGRSLEVTSPGYEKAKKKLRIRVSQVLGDIDIDTGE